MPHDHVRARAVLSARLEPRPGPVLVEAARRAHDVIFELLDELTVEELLGRWGEFSSVA